jgi:hypothetical protein
MNSPWCKKVIGGISDECIKRNYDINTADFDKFYKNHSIYLNKDDAQMILVLGRDELTMTNMASFLNSKGALFIFLNHKLSTLFPETHSILFGFDRAIYSLFQKLTSLKKVRPALVGINPYSYAETEKRNSFKNIVRMYFPEQKIENNILVKNRSHGKQVGKTKVSLFERELEELYINIADTLARSDLNASAVDIERFYLGLVKRGIKKAAKYTKENYLKGHISKLRYGLTLPVKEAYYTLFGIVRTIARDIFRKLKVK